MKFLLLVLVVTSIAARPLRRRSLRRRSVRELDLQLQEAERELNLLRNEPEERHLYNVMCDPFAQLNWQASYNNYNCPARGGTNMHFGTCGGGHCRRERKLTDKAKRGFREGEGDQSSSIDDQQQYGCSGSLSTPDSGPLHTAYQNWITLSLSHANNLIRALFDSLFEVSGASWDGTVTSSGVNGILVKKYQQNGSHMSYAAAVAAMNALNALGANIPSIAWVVSQYENRLLDVFEMSTTLIHWYNGQVSGCQEGEGPYMPDTRSLSERACPLCFCNWCSACASCNYGSLHCPC